MKYSTTIKPFNSLLGQDNLLIHTLSYTNTITIEDLSINVICSSELYGIRRKEIV